MTDRRQTDTTLYLSPYFAQMTYLPQKKRSGQASSAYSHPVTTSMGRSLWTRLLNSQLTKAHTHEGLVQPECWSSQSVTAQLPSTAVHPWDSWGRKRSALNHNFVTESYSNQYEETASAVVSLIQGMASDLKMAHEIDENCYTTFKGKKLETDQPAKKFHDWMKTNKLKTFSDVQEQENEIKWEGSHLESRQIFVWMHHGDITKT